MGMRCALHMRTHCRVDARPSLPAVLCGVEVMHRTLAATFVPGA